MISNLPNYAIPLVGKTSEIREIKALLSDPDCRLLTLLGPGGIGKTRLAVEVISQTDLNFTDGIYFVELQSVSSIDSIVQSIASVLGYEFHNDIDLRTELLNHLGDKHILIVLDNFEHLLHGHETVRAILDHTPHIKLLITSRERLKLHAEWIHEVAGLSYPTKESINNLETYEAPKLFAEHAYRIYHEFSLNKEACSIVQICTLTEGLPLAVELAANWVRTLPCSEIATELQHHLDILETDLYDVPARHRSMRAVFDYSWKLLNEDERHIMMGISTFRGGFHRDAAEHIAGASLKILSSLVDKSLLRINQNGRYEIHELQHQYNAEQLNNLPDLKNQLHDRHCEYYLALMNRPELDFDADHFSLTIHTIDADLDNIRIAWNWAIENRRIGDLINGMKGLYLYAQLRNWHVEVSQAFESAINSLRDDAQTTETQLAVALLLSLQAMIDIRLGRRQMVRRKNLEESVSILRRLNARPELTLAVGGLGWDLLSTGELNTAEPLLEQAIVLAEETNNPQFLSFIMWQLGNLAVQRGQTEVAKNRYHQALEFGKAIRDHRAIIFSLSSLGDLAFEQGLYASAQMYYEQSLETANAIDASVVLLDIRNSLGQIALETGELALAQDYLLETFSLAQQFGKPTTVAMTLMILGDVMLAQAIHEDAQSYYEQAHRIAVASDVPETIAAVQARLGRLALSLKKFYEAERHLTASKNYYHKIGNHPAEANILIDLALAVVANGNHMQAQEYLLDAFRKIANANRPPNTLRAIVGIAQYYMHQGTLTRAVELASLVWQHSASPADAKRRAENVLTQSEVELFASDLKGATQRHRQEDLAKVCIQIVDQLAVQINQPLVEPLSERELEVLQLVANGRSNREIAQDLTVALGTVKSHLHNILQKLDAGNRTEAVAKARELHLL